MIFYRLLYSTTLCVAALCSPFIPKLRAGLWGRRGLTERVRRFSVSGTGAPIWFHVASSGEFEQAIPILDKIKSRKPGQCIFLTVFSPSGRRAVELERVRRVGAGQSLPWDGTDYSPFDLSWTVGGFLEVLRPTALVLLNRELWPEIISGCKAREIPVYLFATSLGEPSRRFLPLYRPWLHSLAFVGTVDLRSQHWLTEVAGVGSVETVGDPRIERVLARRSFSAAQTFERPPDRPRFVGASLWPEDLSALGESLRLLLGRREWQVFLVPHEPEESFLQKIEAEIGRLGGSSVRWSRMESSTTASVVVVDVVGWLAELYRSATVAFVGGSFRKRVHNVLEPAAYAVPVFTGPYIDNSVEALEMSATGAGVFVATDGEMLQEYLRPLIENPDLARHEGAKALEYLQARTGAANRYVEVLLGN